MSEAPAIVETPTLTFNPAARLLFGFVIHDKTSLHWRQRLALTYLQAQRASFPIRHLRWLARRAPTSRAIQQYCDRQGLRRTVVKLDTASVGHSIVGLDLPPPTLHFVTPSAAAASSTNEKAPTLLYFHGGGFVNPLRGSAHMPFIMRCVTACGAKQAVILDYTLAPEHPYPAQFVQAVSTVRYLVDKMGLRPEDIVLAGDSAGGQLVGAVLAHIVKPAPYVPPLAVDGRFRAALFVSPYVRLPADAAVGSYESNGHKDYLNRPQVDKFNAAWKGKGDEIWANLCGPEGSRDVWSKVVAQGLVEKAMVTVGTAEVFLDCCRLFAQEYLQAETAVITRDTDCGTLKSKNFVLVECEDEAHVQVALDSVVGYPKGPMTRAVMSWLESA